jgi:hypothetical protein
MAQASDRWKVATGFQRLIDDVAAAVTPLAPAI